MNTKTIPHMKPGCQLSIWRGAFMRRGRSMSQARIRVLDRIVDGVSRKHGVSKNELLGTSAKRYVVYPRWECWWIMYDSDSYSMTQIAEYFGKDHSTVVYGIRQHERRLADGRGS